MKDKWNSFLQKIKDSAKFKMNLGFLKRKPKEFRPESLSTDEPTLSEAPEASTPSTTKALFSLNWNDFINGIFAANKRPKIHKLFLITLIATSSYQIGKVGALFLSSQVSKGQKAKPMAQTLAPPKAPNTRQEIASIAKNNIFRAKTGKEGVVKKVPKKKVQEVLICEESNSSTGLPLKLLNTVVLQDRVKSIASVQVRNKPMTIREGDKIQNMAEISKITRLKLILKNLKTRKCEYLATKGSGRLKRKNVQVVSPKKGRKLIAATKNKDISVKGNKFKIKKSLRNKLLAGGITELLTQAKAIPIKNPDGTWSFKMTEIVPGSLYTHLDMQDGDLIKQIDGKSINNITEVTSMLGKISTIDSINITIERNGSEQTKEYSFE
jgi:type II secretory pathway component PulC